MNPQFLTTAEILVIHGHMIARYGGTLGLRDSAILESALAQPKSTFEGHYLHKTMFEMAAAYLFHIVMDHPFIDGNKRVGAAAADVFLTMNGYEFSVEPLDFENLVLETAVGNLSKSEIASFLKNHSKPVK